MWWKQNKKWILLLIKVLITVLAIYFLMKKVDLKEIGKRFSTIHLGWFFASLLFFIASKAIAVLRLHKVLEVFQRNISYRDNSKMYLMGMFYNMILPGGIGGDGFKVYYIHKKYAEKPKKLIGAFLFDRGIGMCVLLCVVVICGLFFETGISKWLLFAGLLGLLIGAALITYLFFKSFRKVLGQTIGWSFVMHLIQGISVFCLMFSLGVETGWFYYLIIFLLSAVSLIIPIPTFGGLGVRENVVIFAAEKMMVSSSIAASLSLLFFIVTTLVSLVGVFFHFKEGAISSEEIQKLDKEGE